jgi:hypothetical protein
MLIGAVPAEAQSLLVLKVRSQELAGQGVVLVTLVSGAQIRIPVGDIDELLSKAVESAMASQAADRQARTTLELPSQTIASAAARSKCAKEWPDDFSMRAYCENQQREALAKLRDRVMNTGDMRTIRNKCATDWPDDFNMRNYCEEQQLKALGVLKR